MATFPTTLPGHLSSAHGFTTKDQTVRSDMEMGPARVRRISTARNDTVPLSWVFTDAQMEIFRDWFDLDTGANGGAAWFFMTINVGYGDVTQEARFKSGSIKTSRVGKTWSVSSEVEIR